MTSIISILQAATDDSTPNPFLLEPDGVEAVATNGQRKSGPPGRPPPPHMATASPAHAAPKSAFDDLNDSIRMAMGGNSPAKQPLNTSGLPLGTPQIPNPAGAYPSTFQSSPAKAPMGLIIYFIFFSFFVFFFSIRKMNVFVL